jgi:lipopolysaccharide/colanic/teichoic acid biosynthesis glycosyltransferase
VSKRLFDVIVAGAALAVLSPMMAGIALVVRAALGKPVLFTQERPGLRGRLFRLYKFRTMTDSRDEQGLLRSDSERLTGLGRLMRSTSLDELPELWNVLRGDMSLVGPRPLLIQYLGRYSPEQARRHLARPGLTGWAQVNGRNAVSWPERLAMDSWYVDNWSTWLDLRILVSTVRKVISREGISAPGEATMGEFMGEAPART